MTTRDTAWPEGTPSWADAGVPEIDATVNYYQDLFGWQVLPGDPATGNYRMCLLNGKPAAALSPPMPGAEGHPAAWTVYITSHDLEATCEKITTAGGKVMMPPMAVETFGRMALVADSTGAFFALWQPMDHIGANIVNEPGAMCWNDVYTHDVAKAKEFYAAVFGYTYTQGPAPEGVEYAVGNLTNDAGETNPVMGITELPEGQTQPYWAAWFMVPDATKATEVVAAHKGTVIMPPTDSPHGKMMVLAGPGGEMLGVVEAQ